MRSPWQWLRRATRPRLGLPGVMAALGVLAAVVLAVCSNVLVARFYTRWDWTTRRLYTLSDTTQKVLADLRDPIEVLDLLSRSDPLELTLRQTLASYLSRTQSLTVRHVDPDRNPAEFLAVQQKYGILAGKTEDGRVAADTSLIVSQGERHWFVTSDQLVAYDEQSDEAQPRLEQALTEAILNVQRRERLTVCISVGHQERSLDDGGPHGLGELKYRLEKGNFEVKPVELEAARPPEALPRCRLTVVAGPKVPFSTQGVERLTRMLERGDSLLLLVGPLLGEEERPRTSGLEPLLARLGVTFGRDLLLERDVAVLAPTGTGETFQATPQAHEITAAMLKRDGARVLVSGSQSLGKTPESRAVALLRTSEQAVNVTDLGGLLSGAVPRGGPTKGPFDLAMAAEQPGKGQARREHGSRVVVVGTPSIAVNEVFREPTLSGTRAFTESVLSWLLARPALVEVPARAAQPIGIGLSEASLGEVFRYVLLYMPGTALLLGILVLHRRRARERHSRRSEERGQA